jgi:Xaa-Pro aminopeptidase
MDVSDHHRAARSRIRRLTDHLAEHDLAAAIVVRPEHVRYLTGWASIMSGAVVLTPSGGVLMVPEGTGGEAAAATAGLSLQESQAYSASELIDAEGATAELVRASVRTTIPSGSRGRLGTDLPAFDPTSSAINLTPLLRAWRRVKDSLEIEILRDRVARLEAAFTVARDVIRPGLTETRLNAILIEVLQSSTDVTLRLDANLGSGPRSAEADPHSTRRAMENGDLVLIDLYPRLDGYVADLTRTFVVGHPTSQQEDRWATVREALATGESLLMPGTDVRQIDGAVRAVLARAGTGALKHHVGHGIGLDAWEAPWIGATTNDRLEVGNVITIEPGLYVDGWGGMRLEANYVIGRDGPERLDRFPDTLSGD